MYVNSWTRTIYPIYNVLAYRSNTRAWWTREKVGEYFPIFSKDHQPLIEYLTKLKILQEKPGFKVKAELVKLFLDKIRWSVCNIEASLVLWGVFTAACTLIVVGYYDRPAAKKK